MVLVHVVLDQIEHDVLPADVAGDFRLVFDADEPSDADPRSSRTRPRSCGLPSRRGFVGGELVFVDFAADGTAPGGLGITNRGQAKV